MATYEAHLREDNAGGISSSVEVFGVKRLSAERGRHARQTTTEALINTVMALCAENPNNAYYRNLPGPRGKTTSIAYKPGRNYYQDSHPADKALVSVSNYESKLKLARPYGRNPGIYIAAERLFVDREHEVAMVSRTLNRGLVLGDCQYVAAIKHATEDEVQAALADLVQAAQRADIEFPVTDPRIGGLGIDPF